jgi:signal transduction histidine kinase/CheY-like chemotaxis protein
VARAAVEGKVRHDLLNEATRVLLASGHADRVGVWVEPTQDSPADANQVNSFRGIVADKEGDAVPAGWCRLSPQPPLPGDLLVGLQTVEQELVDSSRQLMIGTLLDMRRALWVPIVIHGHLRGVVFAGQTSKHSHLPRVLCESVAAELALAIELEDERRLGRRRQLDFRRIKAALTGPGSPSDILAGIVKDCTHEGEGEDEPSAVFAAIGCLVDPPQTRKSSIHPPTQRMRFAWQSNAAVWIRTLESEELSGLWRRALESRRVVGSEPGISLSHSGVAHVVAWPLEAAGESLGVLVAGVRRSAASLAALERLELSAALASSALLELKRNEQAAELELRHKEVLAALQKLPDSSPLDNGLTEIRNIIEWLEDGLVLFGPNKEIRALNARFGQIVGLAPEELSGIKTLDDLVAKLAACSSGAGNFADTWHRSDQNPQSAVREELHLVGPVPRLLERAARPILDSKGALLGRVEIYRDLTAQRVFQSKLVQTEKLAGLGQMVTGIAHELSNPLTTILGYAQRLLLRRDSLGGSHEARQIFQEAERASAILRQLLLTARESRPERRRVALNQVVSRTLELQRFSSSAENIRVELDLDPVLPYVHGDPGQLQQVLMNLISNARQALEGQGKGGTIRVRTARIAEKRVLLEVSDDGPGIPQAIQARIFDPFFTTKPAGVGTGLGLAIVLSIVREHGGNLHLTSNPGQNTVFSIELPATAAVDIPSPAIGAAAPSRARFSALPAPESLETAHAGAALATWAGARVLVLEDEPTVARLIADVLEDEGLRVDVLLDAREALDRADRVAYSLVICDMKMPELDGEHFYLALARAKNPLHQRFLFVTGDVLAAHTRDFLDRYHLPHVAKPFRVEELTDKIRFVLQTITSVERTRALAPKKNAARK